MPNKVDEIHDAISRKYPDKSNESAWAMAWAAYKKHEKKQKGRDKATKAAKRAFKNYSDR